MLVLCWLWQCVRRWRLKAHRPNADDCETQPGCHPLSSDRQKAKVKKSTYLEVLCERVSPTPCPPSISTRRSVGLPSARSRAANFAGCQAAIRASFRPILIRNGG